MLNLKRTLAALCFLSLVVTGRLSSAGYPPFGAWAYGSGWYATSHFGHWHGRTVYRSVYRGSYSPWGFTTTVSARSVYRPCIAATYRSWYPSYSFYAYPPIVSYPTYTLPSYVVPTVVWPTYYYSAPVYPTYCTTVSSTASVPGVVGLANSLGPVVPAVSNSVTSSSSAPGQFVAIDYAVKSPVSNAIPAALLSAADAIFQNGGYREAATAYAQLNVRYGSSNTIFARRFVAQVASGDLDQAAVVLASAEAAGFQLHPADLPTGNLLGLFNGDSSKVAMLTEQLAAHAMSATTEQEPFELVGQWLSLAGDQQRSSLFLEMASRLRSDTSTPSPAMLLPKTELVSLE